MQRVAWELPRPETAARRGWQAAGGPELGGRG